MSGSIAGLFQRLTQGVYVVGVAHGEVGGAQCFHRRLGDAGVFRSLAAGEHQSAHSSYGLLKEGRAFSVNVLKKGQLELAAHYGRPAGPAKLAFPSRKRPENP